MKKILMVLSLTLAAIVTNAQTKKFVVERYVESINPSTSNVFEPFGPMEIEICPNYIKIDNVGNVSKYDIISTRKEKDNTIVYKVKGKNGKVLDFYLREDKKTIEYYEKNATLGGTKYYYNKVINIIAG